MAIDQPRATRGSLNQSTQIHRDQQKPLTVISCCQTTLIRFLYLVQGDEHQYGPRIPRANTYSDVGKFLELLCHFRFPFR